MILMTTPQDPQVPLRSKRYLRSLILAVVARKGLAHGASLSSFRGGPGFPFAFPWRGGRHRAKGGAMTRPSDRRLLRYARPARMYLVGLVVVTVAVAGLVILQAQLLATAIAGTFSDGLDLSALTGTIPALAAVVAGRAVLAWAIEALSYRASAG